jgi:hypothetical protein
MENKQELRIKQPSHPKTQARLETSRVTTPPLDPLSSATIWNLASKDVFSTLPEENPIRIVFRAP